MDQTETPVLALTVESESQIVLNKESDISITQQEDNAQAEIFNNIKESHDEVIPETYLKRKVIEEQVNSNLENASKRSRKDSNDNSTSTTDLVADFKNQLLHSAVESDEVYSLIVSNFPETWPFPQICNYVSQTLEGVSVELEPVKEKKNELRLTFNSAEHRINAQIALQNKQVDSNQLQVVIEGPVQYDNDTTSTEETTSMKHDIWEEDPKGLYGLKPEYLNNLKITPPIGKWVHVLNFRCDKSELRDAFELAGHVVSCSIVNTKDKYAKIMYSHPLEAVQAVSMLHDQVFYGVKLSVTMDKVSNSQIMLPKGLTSIGPGLGEDGNPLREITREYERFLNGKNSNINQSLFTAGNIEGIIITHKNNYAVVDSKPPNNAQSNTNPIVTKTNPITAPTRAITPNPTTRPIRPNLGNVRPSDQNNLYRFQNPMFRGSIPRGPRLIGDMGPPGPFSRGFPGPRVRMPMPFGPRPPPGQVHPGPIHPPTPIAAPIPGPSPIRANLQPVGFIPIMSKCMDATTLKISSLPPTTSFPSLCGKLSTLAQVTSLEFTTPGCAIVKFASPSEAEKCFHS